MKSDQHWEDNSFVTHGEHRYGQMWLIHNSCNACK